MSNKDDEAGSRGAANGLLKLSSTRSPTGGVAEVALASSSTRAIGEGGGGGEATKKRIYLAKMRLNKRQKHKTKKKLTSSRILQIIPSIKSQGGRNTF